MNLAYTINMDYEAVLYEVSISRDVERVPYFTRTGSGFSNYAISREWKTEITCKTNASTYRKILDAQLRFEPITCKIKNEDRECDITFLPHDVDLKAVHAFETIEAVIIVYKQIELRIKDELIEMDKCRLRQAT